MIADATAHRIPSTAAYHRPLFFAFMNKTLKPCQALPFMSLKRKRPCASTVEQQAMATFCMCEARLSTMQKEYTQTRKKETKKKSAAKGEMEKWLLDNRLSCAPITVTDPTTGQQINRFMRITKKKGSRALKFSDIELSLSKLVDNLASGDTDHRGDTPAQVWETFREVLGSAVATETVAFKVDKSCERGLKRESLSAAPRHVTAACQKYLDSHHEMTLMARQHRESIAPISGQARQAEPLFSTFIDSLPQPKEGLPKQKVRWSDADGSQTKFIKKKVSVTSPSFKLDAVAPVIEQTFAQWMERYVDRNDDLLSVLRNRKMRESLTEHLVQSLRSYKQTNQTKKYRLAMTSGGREDNN